MHIGNRIEKRMKVVDLSQSQLARRLNVTPQTVHHWIKGKSKPKFERVQKLAELLRCSPGYLMFGDMEEKHQDVSAVGRITSKSRNEDFLLIEIPVFDWSDASKIKEKKPSPVTVSVPSYFSAGCYVLSVKAPDMTPVFPEGTALIVDPDLENRLTNYAIFLLPGAEKMICGEIGARLQITLIDGQVIPHDQQKPATMMGQVIAVIFDL